MSVRRKSVSRRHACRSIRPPRSRAARFPAPFPRTALITAALFLVGSGSSADSAGNDGFPTLITVEELRIGSVDDPDVGFSRIGDVAVDEEGRIYVYEALDDRIRVYSRDGELLRTIGGSGDGPGEFASVSALGVLGDTVWAIEAYRPRLTLFDREGNLLHSGRIGVLRVSLPGDDGSAVITPRALVSGGFLNGRVSAYGSMPGQGEARRAPDGTTFVPRLRFDLEGGIADTIGWQGYWRPFRVGMGEYIEAGPTRYVVPRPAPDLPLVVEMADGWFEVERFRPPSPGSARFRVRRLTETGDTLFDRSYPYRAQPYASAALDTIAWRSARMPGGGYDPVTGPAPTPEGVDIDEVFSRLRAAMDFPEFRMPVDRGVAGDDGTLWLREEDGGDATIRWRVLNGDGSPRGFVELPRALRPVWVGGDQMLGAREDELGVPWLVGFRLEGS